VTSAAPNITTKYQTFVLNFALCNRLLVFLSKKPIAKSSCDISSTKYHHQISNVCAQFCLVERFILPLHFYRLIIHDGKVSIESARILVFRGQYAPIRLYPCIIDICRSERSLCALTALSTIDDGKPEFTLPMYAHRWILTAYDLKF
jgi:hypothetical protein